MLSKTRLNYEEDTNIKQEAEQETGKEDQVQEPARKKTKQRKGDFNSYASCYEETTGSPTKTSETNNKCRRMSLTKRPKGRKKKQDEGQHTASADEIRDEKIREFTKWYSESDNLDYEEVMSRAQGIDGATMLKILGIKKEEKQEKSDERVMQKKLQVNLGRKVGNKSPIKISEITTVTDGEKAEEAKLKEEADKQAAKAKREARRSKTETRKRRKGS